MQLAIKKNDSHMLYTYDEQLLFVLNKDLVIKVEYFVSNYKFSD